MQHVYVYCVVCYAVHIMNMLRMYTVMFDAAGWTPLMYASYVGHDTIVNLLLDTGVDSSRGSHNGLTPLMVAAGCGNESVCYFLLHVCMCVYSQLPQPLTAMLKCCMYIRILYVLCVYCVCRP